MLKKVGFVVTAAAAAALMSGGAAMAAPGDHPVPGHHHGHQDGHGGQVGLLNLDGLDLLHNVDVSPGVCGNDVNVLGVQVPIRNALNGLGIPLLSPGENSTGAEAPYNCASSVIVDGGTSQH